MKISKVEIWLEGEEFPRGFEWSQTQTLAIETGRNWVKVFLHKKHVSETFTVPRDKVNNIWIEEVPNDCEPGK